MDGRLLVWLVLFRYRTWLVCFFKIYCSWILNVFNNSIFLCAVSSIKSLELAAADFVSLFPGIEVFKDSWRQNLVWRGVENIEKFQSVIDQSLYSASNSTNTLLRSPCSAVSPYPQFFIDSSANHQHGTEYGKNSKYIYITIISRFVRLTVSHLLLPLLQ